MTEEANLGREHQSLTTYIFQGQHSDVKYDVYDAPLSETPTAWAFQFTLETPKMTLKDYVPSVRLLRTETVFCDELPTSDRIFTVEVIARDEI